MTVANRIATARSAHSPAIRLIVLTGFMGAGKTTVGRLLAERYGWQFADADAIIEADTGHSIAALFQMHGEAWFRELEHRTIRAFAESKSCIDTDAAPSLGWVLALGGGAIEDARTRRLLLETTGVCLIHLEVSLSEAIRRCTAEAETVRPVLANQDRLAQRYATRLALYRQAPITFAVDDLAPEQIVQNIIEALSLFPLDRSET